MHTYTHESVKQCVNYRSPHYCFSVFFAFKQLCCIINRNKNLCNQMKTMYKHIIHLMNTYEYDEAPYRIEHYLYLIKNCNCNYCIKIYSNIPIMKIILSFVKNETA